ncbi:MAG: hypothetical protein JNK20_15765 [Flavipsychrobacter sp.]|nr:hypothetical protein [Flavipsychrobacter sp.]
MENNLDQSLNLPKNIFKQFKKKEAFQDFFNNFYKEDIEQMLHGELVEHLSPFTFHLSLLNPYGLFSLSIHNSLFAPA